jgi:hypothetical protein
MASEHANRPWPGHFTPAALERPSLRLREASRFGAESCYAREEAELFPRGPKELSDRLGLVEPLSQPKARMRLMQFHVNPIPPAGT